MYHFNRHSLAILPLLSILAMSPSVIESKYAERHIASVVEEVKPEVKKEEVKEEVIEFKKFKEISAKVAPESIIRNENLSLEDLKKQESDLKEKLTKIQIDSKKEDIKKEVVDQDRKDREALVVDLLFIEDGLKGLEERKVLEASDKEVFEKSILAHKGQIEELLVDLEKSEEILAKADAPKEEEPKKEEEVKPVLAEEPKKEEPVIIAEDKKEEEKVVCEAEEKNALLTKQVEQLMNDQKQIMQTMMGMAQMMVSMYQNQNQNQQPNPYYANSMHANPYQYNQPFSSGNWVYYPSGFQPQQQNIFAPQQSQQVMPQLGGYFPDQAHMPQSSWNLAPQYNFQADPRYTVQPIMPGSFGSEAFSYNLSNPAPTNPMPGHPVAMGPSLNMGMNSSFGM